MCSAVHTSERAQFGDCRFLAYSKDTMNHRVHIFIEMNRVSVPAHSAGAYNATLLVMVNVEKRRGVHHPP
jgi:hypothetical protein